MFRKLVVLLVAVSLFVNTLPAHADGPVTLGLGTLTAIALSPDGARLAVGTTLGVYFYDAQTFAPQGGWGTESSARQLIWSPRADMLLILNSGAQARSANDGALLWSTSATCWECEWMFTSDGAQVAQIRNFTSITLLEAATGATLQTLAFDNFFKALDWQVAHLAPNTRLSTNGSRLAVGESGYYGGADALVYNVAGRFASIQTWAHGAALSPDGRALAAGDFDGTVYVYEAGNSKTPRLTLKGHHDGYTNFTFAWSPDSAVLYSAAHNKIIAWDAVSGAQLRMLDGFSAPARQVAWSVDGQRLYIAEEQQLVLADVASRLPLRAVALTPRDWTTDMVVSPAGNLVAVGDWGGATLYNANSLEVVHRLQVGRVVLALAFSPDGRWVATAGRTPFINIWDTTTGRAVKDLAVSGARHGILTLTFDTDSNGLYALDSLGRLRHWDVAAGTSTFVQTYMPPPSAYYYDPSINLPAQRVAVEYGRGGLGVSNIVTGELLYTLNEPNPRSVIINAAGTRLAAIIGNTAKVWDLATGALLAQYTEANGTQYWWRNVTTDITFSPDGARLAVSSENGFVKIWPVP